MGFDRELVDALGRAIRVATADLETITSADVEARSAIGVVRAAGSALRNTWGPFTNGLVLCGALTGYQPAMIGAGELMFSWIASLAAQRRWSVSTDPLAPSPAPITVEQARSLGAALSGAAGEQPMTDEEIAWLADQLAVIAGRPELRAAFLGALTPTGWIDVANQLGQRRQERVTEAVLYDGEVSPDDAAGWAAIDRVFAGLAAVAATDPLSHVDGLDPYAAALLAQGLHLDAETLAALARDLIERERRDFDGPITTNRGPRAADILLTTILMTDGGPTAFVMETLDDPSLLLLTADDPEIGNAVAIAGVAPELMSAEQAAVAIPILARWIPEAANTTLGSQANDRLALAMAGIATPYFLPLLKRQGAYGMTDEEKKAIGDLIIGDAQAFEVVLQHRDAVLDPFSTVGLGYSDLRAAVGDVAATIGIVDTFVRAATVLRGREEREQWELAWSVTGLIADVPSAIGESMAWNLASPGLEAGKAFIEWLGAGPASEVEVNSSSLATQDVVTSVAAASLVCTTFAEMAAEDHIPPGCPLPPLPDLSERDVGGSYKAAFEVWLATSGIDEQFSPRLGAVMDAVYNEHESEANGIATLYGL
jgi:hypothetical protein